MTHVRRMNGNGQGALEYLLLIGGAVLVATIVLVLALTQIFPASGGIVNSNIAGYQNSITLNAAGGGGGSSLCVGGAPNGTWESGEQCDAPQFNSATCVTQGFTGGTLACTSNCRFDTSACTSNPSNPPVISLVATPGNGQVSLSWTITSNFQSGAYSYQIKGDTPMGSMSGVTTQTTFNSFSGAYSSGALTVAASGNATAMK